MARFGRSVPPSTRLSRTTGRYEGTEPRFVQVGVAGSQELARPVNRDPGEVRTARELDTAPAVGRVRTRVVGAAGESNTVLAFAGRTRRRDVGIAGESSSVPAVTRKRRRDVEFAASYETALPAFDKAVVSEAVWRAAIESPDRQPTFTLRADWGRDGQFDHPLSDLSPLVEQVTVERELQGDLPPEVGQIEGYAAASLKATLSGRWPVDNEAAAGVDDLSPAQVFAPYRSDSPLYGAPLMQTPIQLDTGFVTDDGVREDRRFTGTVRRISPRSSGRSVAIDAMDSTFRLRTPITLPGVALYRSTMESVGPGRYRHRINTQWVIDYILRRNGIYASPPPRDDAILSVTGHGSLIPEIGWGGAEQGIYGSDPGRQWFTGAPFGMIYQAFGIGRWWVQQPITAQSGAGFGCSMWMRMEAPNGVDDEEFRVHMSTNATWWLVFGVNSAGRPYIGLDGAGANDTITVSPNAWTPPASGTQWTFVGVHVTFAATSMTVRWRIGGQLYTTTVTIPTRPTDVWSPSPYFDYNLRYRLTNLQVWLTSTPPAAGLWPGEQWTPQADLDPGGNDLTGLPEMIAADGWEVIKEICAAEGSRFQFTESGRPQFRTRIGDASRGTPAVSETITANRNLADLVANTDEASIRNVINLKTTQLLISDWQDYYTPAEPLVCPPGTNIFEVELPSAAYEIPPTLSAQGSLNKPGDYDFAGGDGFLFYSTNERWQESTQNPWHRRYIRVMFARYDDPSVWHGPNMPIRVVRLSPWRMQIIVRNLNSFTVQLSTTRTFNTDGTLAQEAVSSLVIPARIVEAGQEQLETFTDPTSIALYGTSSFDIGGRGSRWCQTPDGLRDLATKVLSTTAHPVPVLDAVDVPHDPRRRIGQRITLADPDGLGTVTATIVGLSTTYSSSGATDRVTVRPIAAPGR